MARSISKNRILRTIFTQLAPYYDRVEPVVTCGQGKKWRRRMLAAAGIQSPHRILEACSGSGLLTAELCRVYGPRSHVIAIDFCPAMATLARQRLRDLGYTRRAEIKVENVEIMPFPDEFFDVVFLSFGLRFVSDISAVLKEIHRVLKSGGRFVLLELGQPTGRVRRWLLHVLREHLFPAWARLVLGAPLILTHPLHDSLYHYPDPEKLSRRILRSGFEEVWFKRLLGGWATLHCARKEGLRLL
jgi:demethylmenaquinone methyltransferase/2-methoxy-6-polyprenyl-1,4-benzoquinol methylase